MKSGKELESLAGRWIYRFATLAVLACIGMTIHGFMDYHWTTFDGHPEKAVVEDPEMISQIVGISASAESVTTQPASQTPKPEEAGKAE